MIVKHESRATGSPELEIRVLAKAFKALGDENRLRILNLLEQQGELCACVLLRSLEISQPTLSHHTRLLQEAGLIAGRKVGKWVHYSLVPERLRELKRCLEIWEAAAQEDLEVYGSCCAEKRTEYLC